MAKYCVGIVGKYHKIGRILSRHHKKAKAVESAKKFSRKFGYRSTVGIYEKSDTSGLMFLMESYVGGKKDTT